MGHGRMPVETLSDHGTSSSANVFKLSIALLIRKMLMENEEKFNFFVFIYLFLGEVFGLEI